MATGWAGDGAVQDQIDATVNDAVQRARQQLRKGPGLAHCEECEQSRHGKGPGAALPDADPGAGLLGFQRQEAMWPGGDHLVGRARQGRGREKTGAGNAGETLA